MSRKRLGGSLLTVGLVVAGLAATAGLAWLVYSAWHRRQMALLQAEQATALVRAKVGKEAAEVQKELGIWQAASNVISAGLKLL